MGLQRKPIRALWRQSEMQDKRLLTQVYERTRLHCFANGMALLLLQHLWAYVQPHLHFGPSGNGILRSYLQFGSFPRLQNQQTAFRPLLCYRKLTNRNLPLRWQIHKVGYCAPFVCHISPLSHR